MVSPLLIMGDFNYILTTEDMIHGSEVQDNETKDFRAFMEDCRINERLTVGRAYTWTNNHVYNRIDRAIMNASWMTSMLSLQVHVLDFYFLDHSPVY